MSANPVLEVIDVQPTDVEQTRDYYVAEARSVGVDDDFVDDFDAVLSHAAESLRHAPTEPHARSWVRQMEGWVAQMYATIHDIPVQAAYAHLDDAGYVVSTYWGRPIVKLEEMYGDEELQKIVTAAEKSEEELAALKDWEREQGIRPGDA
ncbi:hypothetical protein KU306_12195 [Haloferax larsenii]|uniref:Uncharacterized protein n=1 Tax=Haloferax larsenii TaxID=302484 RepID=A0ABY5RDK5_HALLR|nr:hypothetical protein [Haloferax larsenii]UVE49665.1 hypothetical protein KU306_12195 [Haloferax larsenii]